MKAKKTQKKQKFSEDNLVNIKKKPLKSKGKKADGRKGKKFLAKREDTDGDEQVVQIAEVGVSNGRKSLPKSQKPSTSEHVEENYMIVPWASSEEWDIVCHQFHERNYKEVIAKIGMWQKRVPSLPVGVEATLFLLEAFLYDEKFMSSTENRGFYTEDQARSLYSLAIIRYLNHVSQLATQSLGRPSKKLTRELAAIVDTPEWLVSLRNDVSHGPSAPSIEVLRMGGDFVLQWLKEKYWKLPEESVNSTNATNGLFTMLPRIDEVNASSQISELLAAYIAARIYKMRRLPSINDPEILRHIPNSLSAVKTKTAVMDLKNLIRPYVVSHPSLFCVIVSQELIPNFEFYEDFKSILKFKDGENNDDVAFNKFYGLWMPIVKLLESKGKLISVLNNLAQVITNPEFEKMWLVSARWIDKFLEMIEYSGKKYSKHLVNVLRIVIKHPNYSMQYFLERLFRLTEARLGSETVQKLAYLASIWLEEKAETKKRRKQNVVTIFTLDDIDKDRVDPSQETVADTANPRRQINETLSIAWMPDERSEEFWRTIPMGGIF